MHAFFLLALPPLVEATTIDLEAAATRISSDIDAAINSLLHANAFTNFRADGHCGSTYDDAGCDPSSMKTCCSPQGMCVAKIWAETECVGKDFHNHEDHPKCRDPHGHAVEFPCAHRDVRADQTYKAPTHDASTYFDAPINAGKKQTAELQSLLAAYKQRKFASALAMGWDTAATPPTAQRQRDGVAIMGRLGYLGEQAKEAASRLAEEKKRMGIETTHTDFIDFVAQSPAHLNALHAALGAEDEDVNELMLGLGSSSASVVPAEIVVVFAMERTASTSIANAIGSHACSISFDEVISRANVAPGESASVPNGLPESERDCLAAVSPCKWVEPRGCKSAVWHNRFSDPLAATLAARESWCGRPRAADARGSIHSSSPWPSCGSSCVVVVVLHSANVMGFLTTTLRKEHYAPLLQYAGTRVVVLKRHDTLAQYCSLRFSLHTGNYHRSASQSARKFKKDWQAKHCPTVVPKQYVKQADDWYEWGRETLRESRSTWIELTTEEYAQDQISTEAKLHAFAGLPAQEYRGSCNGNGCNCEYESV